MYFEWAGKEHKQLFDSFSSLVNYNFGVYKSLKQKNFIERFINKNFVDQFKYANEYGVQIENGQKVILVHATAKWGKGVGKGRRDITWSFVLDKYGVVAMYRHRRTNGKINPLKNEVIYIRTEGANEALNRLNKELEKQEKNDKDWEEKRKNSKHFGEVGKRYELDLKVIYTKSFKSNYGWNNYVDILNLEDAEGCRYKWKASNSQYFKGDRLKMKATIKEHIEERRWKVTVIARPRILEDKQHCPFCKGEGCHTCQ